MLFEKMMSELDPETLEKASVATDPFEVVAMALILNQQKMIRKLMQKTGPLEFPFIFLTELPRPSPLPLMPQRSCFLNFFCLRNRTVKTLEVPARCAV
jgi:hypothetical protein